MKKITQLHKHLTNKSRVSQKLLLITVLCFAFSVNGQVRLVKDIMPGSGNSDPGTFYAFDNSLYFSGGIVSPTFNGRAIYRSDGTDAGSEAIYHLPFGPSPLLLRDTKGVANFSDPSAHFYEYNSELYFDAYFDDIHQNGTRIFKLPNGGTSEAVEIYSFYGNTVTYNDARIPNAVFLNDKIISGYYRQGTGNEPFAIDLITPANSEIFNLNPGVVHSHPNSFTIFNNMVYFSANDGTNGQELWVTDGTSVGTQLFANINTGSGDSFPGEFTLIGSNMLFAATNAFTGRELFVTDGTIAGTTIVSNINPGNGDFNPTNLTKIGSVIYFSADNGTDGQELWKTDGTAAGTIQIKNINPTGDSNPANFTQFGSNVYFTATDGVNGIELYVTNGSPNVAVLVKDINLTGDSDPKDLVVYNGKLYFTAYDGIDKELWSANGNSNGTVEIDIYPGLNSANPYDLFVFNDELYFNADSPSGIEPHAYMDPTLSVDNFNSLETTISLFPNPTSNYFEIETKETLTKVNIYSLQGQNVKSFSPQNQYDISDLSSGMYFVKILANNNEVTKQIIKQ